MIADVAADVPDDVVDAGPACDPNKAFGSPVEITELSNVGLYMGLPRLTHDELTIYFDAAEGPDGGGLTWTGNQDIVRATRASLTSPFTNITTLSSINTTGTDFEGSPSGNDLTLFYASGPSAVDLYTATRANTTAPFGNVTALSINTTQNETPYVFPDTLTLYYATVGTGGFREIARATRATTNDPFVRDTSGLFTFVNYFNRVQYAPAVTLDELTLFYATDTQTNSNYDIFVSTRPNTTSQFAKGTLLYSSNNADRPGFISDDGCRLYMVSDGAGGQPRIYVMTRPL